jgi:HisJ family histidinol phosphate phosphatase
MQFSTRLSRSGALTTDYHMHTTFSDGDSTIEEYVRAAEELGLSEIAVTDHVWRRSDWVAEYVDRIRAVDAETDVTVHVGLEAKVVDDEGNVDVLPTDAERVDFVMGVVHQYQPENAAPNDDMLNFEPRRAATRERDLSLALLENDTVDVVGHPSRTYYKFFYQDRTEQEFPTEYFVDLIERSKETGTPLEYNARLPRTVRCRLLDLYEEHNLPFTVGSDTHSVTRFQNLHQNLLRTTFS